jgi:hypothetical protein
VRDRHKTKFLNGCDELSNGCGPYKDQVLGVFITLTQKYVSFISKIFLKCFAWCVCVVWDFWYTTYLYDIKDLIQNWLS